MSTLLERAVNINWLRGTPNDSEFSYTVKIPPKSIQLQFSNVGLPRKDYPLQENEARSIYFSIGKDVCDLLGWKEGDSIYMDHNPDSLLEVRLIKKELGGKGHATKLRNLRGGLVTQKAYVHHKSVKLLIAKRFEVQYHIFGSNQILLRLEKVKMIGEAQ